MPRWHKEICSKPRVVITGNTPRCEACDSVPDLEKYINQQRAIPSFIQPPPDPPLGQLNLRWPSSVEYKQHSTRIVQLEGDTVIEPRDDKKASQSPIYSSRLGKDEFRLLFLSPSTDCDTPIHGELVVHQDGRSPQYESTSYTWAGENGDNSKCRPLYIGCYWDVVLQTQNCWSMLQSLRLPIGTRAVWVDAICINQNDVEERDSQVIKMSQMYKNCHRVVVYLGPDMATTIPAGYPAQKELVLSNSKLPTGISPDSFREILCRRYFSRIWVVQELVLARRVAFQIGDSEYWMDSTTMRSLEAHNNWDWNSTTAPWLQNVGLQRLQETNIFHILRATHMCQCADPRDSIFGILSLLSNKSADAVLRPDYSLSFREMVIGLFSYTLLELRDLGVLRFAAGLRNYSKFPSWMPDLSLSAYHDSSQNELRLPDCQSIVGHNEVHHGGTPWYLGTTVDSSTGALSIDLIHLLEFESSPRKMEDVELIKGWHPFTVSGRHSNLVLSSNIPLDELIVPFRDHLFCLNEENGSPIFLVMSHEIDNNTYKLVGVCRHVVFQDQRLYLRRSIQEWDDCEKRDQAGFRGGQNLNLGSLRYNLHTQLQALTKDDTSTDIWADNPTRISSFKARLRFGHGSDCTLKSILMSLINEQKSIEPGLLASLSLCIPTSFSPQVEDDKYILVTLTKALAATIRSKWWDNPVNKWRLVGQTCSGSSPDKNCSCQKAFEDASIIRDRERRRQKSYPNYLLLVDILSKYSSREKDGREYGSVSGHCMLWQDYAVYDRAIFYMWPHARPFSGSLFVPHEKKVLWPEGLAVQIRIPREAIESQIKQMMAWKTLHRLNHVSPISSEDDLDAILDGPNPNLDFRSIAVPGWPTELVDDFNIDGSIRRVSIQ
ncbi:heterokaryon incompatibility het-6 [Fusarium mundagurra]|uniref:Heterokaryon incompatibility het-6 n=1 Tax=Fusarium mundagurra TaxID=1567541 RepID=A0A8H6DDH6_9HYPO|nr:heterokaryon incompatibility het-6 [Fusarium mundagurra]